MRYTSGPGNSHRSYAVCYVNLLSVWQVAFLGTQDKTSRLPSAWSYDDTMERSYGGDRLLKLHWPCSPTGQTFFWALIPNIRIWLMNNLCIPLSIHTFKILSFCVYIHQRISTFKSVSIFQPANQVWTQVSSHCNKKKQGLIQVFPFNLPFFRNLRQKYVPLWVPGKSVHFSALSAQFQSIF